MSNYVFRLTPVSNDFCDKAPSVRSSFGWHIIISHNQYDMEESLFVDFHQLIQYVKQEYLKVLANTKPSMKYIHSWDDYCKWGNYLINVKDCYFTLYVHSLSEIHYNTLVNVIKKEIN